MSTNFFLKVRLIFGKYKAELEEDQMEVTGKISHQFQQMQKDSQGEDNELSDTGTVFFGV